MPYKLYVVALVALFDAVDTDGVPVRRVAGVTPGEAAGEDSAWKSTTAGHQPGR